MVNFAVYNLIEVPTCYSATHSVVKNFLVK